MSIQALNWARRTRTGSASRKAVLMALANYANEDWEAYPSVETLSSDTELNRKTILASMRELVDAGLVSDTGDKRGRTRSIRVYRLNGAGEAVPKTEQYQKRNSTENGHEAVPKTDKKQYQKRDTEPLKEPLLDTGNNKHGGRHRRDEPDKPLLAPVKRHRTMDWLVDRPVQESAPEARARRARALMEQATANEEAEAQRRINRFYGTEDWED